MYLSRSREDLLAPDEREGEKVTGMTFERLVHMICQKVCSQACTLRFPPILFLRAQVKEVITLRHFLGSTRTLLTSKILVVILSQSGLHSTSIIMKNI